MKTIWGVFVGLCLVLLVVGCSGADIEDQTNQNNGSDLKKPLTSNNNSNTANGTKGGSESVVDSKKGSNQLKRDGDKVEGAVSDLNKSNSTNQSPKIEAHDVQTKKGDSSDSLPVKKGDDEKKKMDNGLEEPGQETKHGLRKEGSHVEECDPSIRCIDEENKLVACLRVPGNESPHLSLLIQNQGKGPLTVKIAAPDFVKLEKTKVELQEKDNKEVKVSIENEGTDTLINLTAGNGRCTLDLRDLVAQNSKKNSDRISKFTYNSFLTRTPTIAIVALAALLIVASSWVCISFRRKHLSSNASKYQRLDMELPVAAVGGKSELEVDDGWDNSWGDDWDDEEAPKTPSLPVTPSLSSKGLAPRRLVKDGWKD